MDVDALRLLAALAGAITVASLAAGVALAGGPRRRPAMTPGVTGGRVRLPSRALERMALVAVGIVLGLLSWLAEASAPGVIASLFAAVCLAFALRRGAMLALATREAGPDDAADDGYVDGIPGLDDG